MKITNKHVAIVAVILSFLAWHYYANQEEVAQQAAAQKAAEEAYNALPVEEKVALDVRDKFVKPYLYDFSNGEGLITGADVKNLGIVTDENGRIGYDTPDGVFINAMLEKDYPKNGGYAPSCGQAKFTYMKVLDAIEETDGDRDRIILRLRSEQEQKGGLFNVWGEREQKVAGGMIIFAELHYNLGIKNIERGLHGQKLKNFNADNQWKITMVKEFESMCFEKGNVGMMQTMMIMNDHFKLVEE